MRVAGHFAGIGCVVLALSGCATSSIESKQLFDQGDYVGSLRGLQRLSVNKDAEAEADLGYLYQYGIGVPHNEYHALQLYEDAAAHGFVDAINRQGIIYTQGVTTVRDYPKAITLFQTASDKGDPYATANLSLMYYYGLGVSKDVEKGKELEAAYSTPSVATSWKRFGYAIRDCVDSHKVYPGTAVAARQMGTVTMGFSIDRDVATNITVDRSAGSPDLDRAAVAALAMCTFPNPPPGLMPPEKFALAVTFRM